ncbi:MAG: hypothetical protein ABJ015_06855, partial [Rhodopirellula bahusiensis]
LLARFVRDGRRVEEIIDVGFSGGIKSAGEVFSADTQHDSLDLNALGAFLAGSSESSTNEVVWELSHYWYLALATHDEVKQLLDPVNYQDQTAGAR